MKQFVLLFAFLGMLGSGLAQVGQGALKGTVTEHKTGLGIPFANIALKQNATLISGTSTDFDGNFEIKPVPAGSYEVEISSLGFAPLKITNVIISAGKTSFIDNDSLKMENSAVVLAEFRCVKNKVRLIEKDGAATSTTVTSSDIRSMAARSPGVLATTVGGTYSKDNGASHMSVRGQRSSSSYYYTDGIKVRGSTSILGGDADALMNQNPEGPGILDGGLNQPSWASYRKAKRKNPELFIEEVEVYTPSVFDLQHEDYEFYAENAFLRSLKEPLSTVSIDVDRGSYTNARRIINDGFLPPLSSVRLEEFVNYFPLERAAEDDSEHPFIVNSELGACPWNEDHQLLRVTMQADAIEIEDRMPVNLVFLIDVSGSMDYESKLGLVKRAFHLLTDQLDERDRVSIVVYAGSSGKIIDGARGSSSAELHNALSNLTAGGSTAGGQGIKLAYKTAEQHFIKDGVNRVILATDGDFNVGVSSDEALVKLIEEKRKSGVFLTTLGFGMGNYKDAKLEKLADHGNGNYAYIDTYKEARKVFLKEFTGTLFTLAKDVKFQIEFNPSKVESYRLLGYENRMLETEDFDDDTKDAGELGAEHMVTFFYEIVPAKKANEETIASTRFTTTSLNAKAQGDELIYLKIRYKMPKATTSTLVERPVVLAVKPGEELSESFRFASAVVQFGLILRNSEHKGESNIADVVRTAKDAMTHDPEGYRREFVTLAEMVGEMYAAQP